MKHAAAQGERDLGRWPQFLRSDASCWMAIEHHPENCFQWPLDERRGSRAGWIQTPSTTDRRHYPGGRDGPVKADLGTTPSPGDIARGSDRGYRTASFVGTS